MDNVELEDLCRRALSKMHLELVGKQDNDSSLGTFWLVRPIKPLAFCLARKTYYLMPLVEFECGTARFGAIAPSIGDVADRLFNLPTKGASQVYLKTFYYSDGNRIHRIENIFAGKSLEEACIMVDLM